MSELSTYLKSFKGIVTSTFPLLKIQQGEATQSCRHC